jgi:hypothetical protein
MEPLEHTVELVNGASQVTVNVDHRFARRDDEPQVALWLSEAIAVRTWKRGRVAHLGFARRRKEQHQHGQ